MRGLVLSLLCVSLMGCAATKTEPRDLPQGEYEASAAVASAPLWRWLGKAILQFIKNTNVVVRVDR